MRFRVIILWFSMCMVCAAATTNAPQYDITADASNIIKSIYWPLYFFDLNPTNRVALIGDIESLIATNNTTNIPGYAVSSSYSTNAGFAASAFTATNCVNCPTAALTNGLATADITNGLQSASAANTNNASLTITNGLETVTAAGVLTNGFALTYGTYANLTVGNSTTSQVAVATIGGLTNFGSGYALSNFTVSGLTQYRVPVASTGGLLADDADFQWKPTGNKNGLLLWGGGGAGNYGLTFGQVGTGDTAFDTVYWGAGAGQWNFGSGKDASHPYVQFTCPGGSLVFGSDVDIGRYYGGTLRFTSRGYGLWGESAVIIDDTASSIYGGGLGIDTFLETRIGDLSVTVNGDYFSWDVIGERLHLYSGGLSTDVFSVDVSTGDTTILGSTTTSQFKLSALNTAPASATDTGVIGEVRITAGAIYVCIATNTWKKAALASW